MTKAVAKNLLLSVITIASLFAAGEVTLNIFDIVKPETPEVAEDYRGWRPDPVLNRAHIPGLKFVYTAQDGKEFRTPVEYNSKGLNDHEYDYAKPEGTSRILVMGDSFVEAIQVKRQENFCELMEEELKKKQLKKRYEIINMGVSGHSPILEYLYLKREGLKYRPDMVVFCFFMNDVYEDSTYKGLAAFDDLGLPVEVRWAGIDKAKKLTGWKKLERRFCNAAKGALNKSKFYTFLKQRFYRLLHKAKMKEMKAKENPFFILQRKPQTAIRYDLWSDTFRYILAAKELAEENNAKFIFVTIPLESQISGDTENAAFRAYFKEMPFSERVESKIAGFCKKYKIEYISLLKELTARESGNLYFKNDGHFNAEGHEEVAGIVMNKLESLKWIK